MVEKDPRRLIGIEERLLEIDIAKYYEATDGQQQVLFLWQDTNGFPLGLVQDPGADEGDHPFRQDVNSLDIADWAKLRERKIPAPKGWKGEWPPTSAAELLSRPDPMLPCVYSCDKKCSHRYDVWSQEQSKN
jgi:hypothetical protein